MAYGPNYDMADSYSKGKSASSIASILAESDSNKVRQAVNQGYEQAKVDILPRALEQGRLEGYDLGTRDGEIVGAKKVHNALTRSNQNGYGLSALAQPKAPISELWGDLNKLR